jgi:hypothetical protein
MMQMTIQDAEQYATQTGKVWDSYIAVSKRQNNGWGAGHWYDWRVERLFASPRLRREWNLSEERRHDA